MQYSYRYDQKLKKRVKKKGLYMGDFMHQLEEAYFKNLMSSKNPAWQKRFKAVEKELWAPLFDEEKEQYEEDGFTPKVAFDLMSHYDEHWRPADSKCRVIEVEGEYDLVTKYGFPVRWKSDRILRDGKDLVLMETKNKKNIPTAEERILAGQTHGYCFLLSKKGIKINRIIWDYVRTEPVPRPKIKKDGSLSERKINTDQRGYLLSLKEAGIHPKGDEAIGVQNYLDSLPETLSLERIPSIPNLKVGELFVRDWVERALRARDIKRPTRTWNRDCKWGCDYYLLCQADMTGKPDRNTIIKRDFVVNIKPVKEDPNAGD
jgi:hypothetical protein